MDENRNVPGLASEFLELAEKFAAIGYLAVPNIQLIASELAIGLTQQSHDADSKIVRAFAHNIQTPLDPVLEVVKRYASPLPSTDYTDKPLVILQGRNLPALVSAHEKRINGSQYDLIEALIKSKPGGLTKDGIEKIRGDARGILRRLRSKDKDWAAVIHMADMSSGRYRID